MHQWRHQVNVLIQENDRSSPQIFRAKRMRLDEANDLSFSSSSRSSISAARVLKRESTFVVRTADAVIYHQMVSEATTTTGCSSKNRNSATGCLCLNNTATILCLVSARLYPCSVDSFRYKARIRMTADGTSFASLTQRKG